jgi:NAD+ diphosphatase
VSFPHLDLAANAHDRAGVRRLDETWLAQEWADPTSRVLLVAETRIRPVAGRLDWCAPGDAPPGTRLLLGERDGQTWWAVLIDQDDAPGERADWVGLRAVLIDLAASPEGEAPLLLHAIGLAEWHHATRFCPACGGPLESGAAGHELVCHSCGKTQFPRTDPAVTMAVTFGEPGAEDELCLLGRQAAWPPGRFSTLAGFCEPGESLEDAVRREVLEEVGVTVGEVRYFGNQAWPLPGSLMLGFVGRAISREIVVDPHEIEHARWFTRAEMREETEAGSLVLPSGLSISRSLVEDWYGGPLPGTW